MMRGSFSISCLFRNMTDGFQWIYTSVYGPIMGGVREDFWEELGAIRGLWTEPWCIGGDFNVTKFPGESNKGGEIYVSYEAFFKS